MPRHISLTYILNQRYFLALIQPQVRKKRKVYIYPQILFSFVA
jgi:hypothetical protein